MRVIARRKPKNQKKTERKNIIIIIPQLCRHFFRTCCCEDLLWAPRPASFSARTVYNMGQCCKITGFPQCFLLFMRVSMATLEQLHVGGSRAFPAELAQLRNPWRRRRARAKEALAPGLLAHKKPHCRAGRNQSTARTGAMFKYMHTKMRIRPSWV